MCSSDLPLKDRIGAEIRTHYPATAEEGIAITAQEAWTARGGNKKLQMPEFIREIVEEIAFLARSDKRIDKRSGVSQRLPISCMETVVSNAERRAIANREKDVVPRVSDVYAALPALTGKFELEYEGELKGADSIARELIRGAVSKVFDKYFADADLQQIVQWFELGGSLKIPEDDSANAVVNSLRKIQGLLDKSSAAGKPDRPCDGWTAAAGEFVLEGLHAHRRIGRSEERGFTMEARKQQTPSRDELRPRHQFN